LLHLVGYLYYWQMGFKSVFKGLASILTQCLKEVQYFCHKQVTNKAENSSYLGPY